MSKEDKNNIEEEELNTQTEGQENETVSEENEVDQLKAELEDQKKKYLLLYSDFENFRKRTQKERLDLIDNAGADVLKSVLPIIDDFERAVANNATIDDPEKLKANFSMLYDKMLKTLGVKGLKKMNSKGTDFDPELHEAITKIPAPTPDLKGKVVDAIEDGYYLNDKIIRFAKVVVGE